MGTSHGRPGFSPKGQGVPGFNSGGGVSVVAPATPTGLAASAITSTGCHLDWNLSATATGYRVYQDAVQIADQADNTQLVVSGLTPSTLYAFTVSAYNSGGASAQSSAVNVTTLNSLYGGLVSLWKLDGGTA